MSNSQTIGKVLIFLAFFIIIIRGFDFIMGTGDGIASIIILAIGALILIAGIILYRKKESE